MRTALARVSVALSLIASAALVTAAPASAAASTSSKLVVDGVRVAEAFFNRGAPAWIDLYDARCEGDPVYVVYSIDGVEQPRHNNNDGCGRTTRVNLRSGYFTIKYRACVNVHLAPDICTSGGRTYDHN